MLNVKILTLDFFLKILNFIVALFDLLIDQLEFASWQVLFIRGAVGRVVTTGRVIV